ncbi:hypothetical protein JKP88DRAFT_191255 [Tribonema minus]|uniref:Activator of Hsp90 ATPase AHSA1-like N-terminal domain-containing protein n=1 Tax=Tribonema minus TaxID=303371 RepID=A0A835ZEF2_9STRA|nr:hypothetical protein JKP88DRAFT_191255 [Tribonema minus]
MFSEHTPFSEHGDVLNAAPSDEPGKKALVEELKSRARGAFAAKNYPVAEKLYSKGIETLPDAMLYANRSAARAGLGRHAAALDDAEEALKLLPTYPKGYWRKGVACLGLGASHAADALAAFQAGEKLEPGNAAWKGQIAKASALIGAGGGGASDSAQGGGGGAAAAAAPARQAPAADADVEAAAKKEDSSHLRGYKKTADGRTTTYFNRDLSEHERALIGDIAPKKLEGAGQGGSPVAPAVAEGVSSWNVAGTWEERDASAWCSERITALLSGLVADAPPGPVRIAKVQEVTGDASITFSRGKRRSLFEFSVKADWEAQWPCGLAKGTIHFPDMSYDCMGEYEAVVTVDSSTAPAARPLVDSFVKAEDRGLRAAMNAKFAQFVEEFNSKQ